MTDADLYTEASEIAYRAMTRKHNHLTNFPHPAVTDPLAHWLLTEWIVSLCQKYSYPEGSA